MNLLSVTIASEKVAVMSNIVPFIGLALLLIFVITNSTFDRRQSKMFVAAIITCMVALIAISFDFIISMKGDVAGLYVYRRLTSFLNFALSPAIPFLLYAISIEKKPHWAFWLPLAVNALLCFLSMFWNIIFYISSKNAYDRGLLFFLPFTISVFYLIVLIFKSVAAHKRSKKKERCFLAGVIVLLCLGMVFEIALHLYFISWDVAAISFIMYYLLLNINALTIDSLTHLYNRVMYKSKLDGLDDQYGYFLALMDINDFKSINDVYGHEAGDKCLIYFASVLSSKLSEHAMVFRTGGDEFVCIGKMNDFKNFEKGIEEMRVEVSEKSIAFACGIAFSGDGISSDELLRRADKYMYEEKNGMKITETDSCAKV